METSLSDSRPAPSGVPQGSCLSPILYASFVLDLARHLTMPVRYLMFADDLKLWSIIGKEADCIHLQHSIDQIMSWCSENDMQISVQKCAVLQYGSLPSNYHIDGRDIPCLESVRDLGVLMTPDLNFSQHIFDCTRSARIITNTIFRCFIGRDPIVYTHLFKTLVLPKLLYCSPIWRPFLVEHEEAIEDVQRYFQRRLRLRCDC